MQKTEEYLVLIHKSGKLIGAYTAQEAHDYLSDVLAPSTTLPVEVPPVVIITPEPAPEPGPAKVKDVFARVGEELSVQLPDFGAPYDLSDLPPGGLRWDGSTRTISGTPTQAGAREMSLKNASGVLATFGLAITASTPVWPDEKPEKENTGQSGIRDYRQIDTIS